MTTADQAPAPATHGWMDAWLTTFENAAADPVMLLTGERLLDRADIGQVHINPGTVQAALTMPNAARPHQPCLTIRPLPCSEWERVYQAIAATGEHADVIAAGRLPDALSDPANQDVIRIVPAPGDITFTCSCRPDPGICPHSAAVGYRVAQHVRANPGVLLTLRGGSIKELRIMLRQSIPLATESASLPERARTGLDAHQAFGRFTDRPTLPGPSRARTTPASLLDGLRADPPAPGPTVHSLRLLTRNAAARASQILAGRPCPAGDDPVQDAARLLADPVHRAHLEHAAEQLGLSTLQMRDLALAHEYGGAAGVEVALSPLAADAEALAHAEAAIQPHRPAQLASLVSQDNQLTDAAARIQLRLGSDGLWYPFTDWHGTWRPAPGPSKNPATAYKAARRTLRDR